jgi:hypothetical protein
MPRHPPWRKQEAIAMHASAATGTAVVIDVDAERACWHRLEGVPSDLVFLFQEWEPAIRVGIHAYLAYPGRDFDSIEADIGMAYQRVRGESRIPWSRAAPAARRMWQKLRDDV